MKSQFEKLLNTTYSGLLLQTELLIGKNAQEHFYLRKILKNKRKPRIFHYKICPFLQVLYTHLPQYSINQEY